MLMSLDELYFIVVVIAMVLEPQHLVIGSIYFYGAEGAYCFLHFIYSHVFHLIFGPMTS